MLTGRAARPLGMKIAVAVWHKKCYKNPGENKSKFVQIFLVFLRWKRYFLTMNYFDAQDEKSMTPAEFDNVLARERGTVSAAPVVDYSSPGFTAATFAPLPVAEVKKEEKEISALFPVAIVAFFFLAGYLAFVLA